MLLQDPAVKEAVQELLERKGILENMIKQIEQAMQDAQAAENDEEHD